MKDMTIFDADIPAMEAIKRSEQVGSIREGRASTPMSEAIIKQDKSIAELDMVINTLRDKLQPILNPRIMSETRADRTEPSPENSDLVNAINNLTSRIREVTEYVQYIKEGIEL